MSRYSERQKLISLNYVVILDIDVGCKGRNATGYCKYAILEEKVTIFIWFI